MRFVLHRYFDDKNTVSHSFDLPLRAFRALTEHNDGPDASNALIVDGGAFNGPFVDAARTRFPESKIVAFEPNPNNVKSLQLRFPPEMHPNIALNEKALGNKTGPTTFLSPVDTGGLDPAGFLAGAGVPSVVRLKTPVESVRLDEVLGRAPDLLKLDLQGGELNALLGMGEMLRQTPLMWVEATLSRGLGTDLIKHIEQAGFMVLYGPFQFGVADLDVLQTLAKLGVRTSKTHTIGVSHGYIHDRYAPVGLGAYGLNEIPGLHYFCTDLLCFNLAFPYMQEAANTFIEDLAQSSVLRSIP